MVDLAMLQVVRDLVAIFGVIAGFTYYVMTVRNNNKARKTQQLLLLHQRWFEKETQRDLIELNEMEWDDYDDFLEKYDSAVNPDNFSKRTFLWNYMDGLGYLLSQNLIDIESVYYLMSGFVPEFMWRKWEPILIERRKRYNNPDLYIWFEYLANEIKKMRVKRGLASETIDVDGYLKK